MGDIPSSTAIDPLDGGARRRQRPGLALALPLCIVALAALTQLPGGWLERRHERLRRAWEPRGRASALELIKELPPAARARVLAALSREIKAAQRGDELVEIEPLRQVVERCGRAADAACAAALARLNGWQEQGRIPLLWHLGLRLGLLALLALVAGIVGWSAVRHTRGRLAGLCLLGVALVIAGAAWRGHELVRQDGARQRAFALDLLVARGRLLVELPADGSAARFDALIEALAALEARPDHLRQLRAAAERCRGRGAGVKLAGVRVRQRCGDLLAALARIHAENREQPVASRVRVWISRWLLWTGLVFLLLSALISAARRVRAEDG